MIVRLKLAQALCTEQRLHDLEGRSHVGRPVSSAGVLDEPIQALAVLVREREADSL
jgi:hypothetical protein